MNVIIFGASGMVGQGVLRACVLDQAVSRVLVIGRSSIGVPPADKVREALLPDPGDLTTIDDQLGGYDACFFCLGISAAGMTEAQYRVVTYDLTVKAAGTLARRSPGMTFIYVSGAGTDTSEQGRAMWARVKGATENALLKLPFKAAYMFRPGLIRPRHGVKSKTRVYRIFYALLAPVLPLLHWLFPRMMTDTDNVGRAMLAAARHGAPKRWLENADIEALARGEAQPSS